jgi:hypothetical protein
MQTRTEKEITDEFNTKLTEVYALLRNTVNDLVLPWNLYVKKEELQAVITTLKDVYEVEDPSCKETLDIKSFQTHVPLKAQMELALGYLYSKMWEQDHDKSCLEEAEKYLKLALDKTKNAHRSEADAVANAAAQELADVQYRMGSFHGDNAKPEVSQQFFKSARETLNTQRTVLAPGFMGEGARRHLETMDEVLQNSLKKSEQKPEQDKNSVNPVSTAPTP